MNQFSGTNQRNEKETRVIIVRHKRQGVKSKRQINKQNRNKSYRESRTGWGRKRREIGEGDCKESTSSCKTEMSHRCTVWETINNNVTSLYHDSNNCTYHAF